VVFIFRPGGTPDPANGVYTTWASVMAALAAAPAGTKILQWDDSVTSPIVIPVGTYSMLDIIWARAATANALCLINLGEGRAFTKLRSINGSLRITFTGATPPVSDFVADDNVNLDGGAIVRCSGTGPFLRNNVVGGRPVVINLGSASISAAGNPVFDSSVVGAFSIIAASSYDSTLDPNMLMGVDGSTIALVPFGLGIGGLGRSGLSDFHPNFDGTLVPVDGQNRWQARVPPVITANTVLQTANQLVRVDPTAGPVTITLPSAKGNRGIPLLIKNVSASINPITIVGAAGDTVDGSALGTIIATARGSKASGLMLIANGVSDWELF